MKLSQKTILILSSVMAAALLGLIIIQVYWLRQGIELNRQQFENKMAIVNDRLHQHIRKDRKLLASAHEFSKGLSGPLMFGFSDDSTLSIIEQKTRIHIDSVLRDLGAEGDYTLHGLVSSERFCWVMHDLTGRPDIPLIHTERQVCACHWMPGGAYDFGFTFVEKSWLSPSRILGLAIPSILITSLLIAVFTITILILTRHKRLSELKNDFINNLTHEFKTPIFSIGLGARMLREAKEIQASGKLRDYVALIEREKMRLQHQVDKVLQMAVIDAGNLMLDLRPVPMHPLISKSTESFRMMVEEKGGTFSLHLKARNSVIEADEVHIANLIYNLIDNACKYSPIFPEIVIRTFDHPSGFGLSIRDNGMGMDSVAQRSAFERFYRGQQGDVHDVKGFGLGLSYVKSIVDLHKGEITFVSTPGKGTEFTIILPPGP